MMNLRCIAMEIDKFYRTKGIDAKIGGVCGGIARFAQWDPLIIRILAICLIMGTGFFTLVFFYILVWILAEAQ